MEDTYRHKGLRKRLVDHLRQKGIKNESVLEAINTVPRHFFLDKAFEELAYEDKAMQIGEGQTISQPYTVAFQTELLEVSKRMKVLEIGTGSGYQAAILSVLGARVYSIERHEYLHLQSQKMMDQLGLSNVRLFFNDGTKGLGEFAPFDRIIVTCATETVPDILLSQLNSEGVMVIPVGNKLGQNMLKIKKTANGEFIYEKFNEFKFVPLLSGKNYM